jgi:hypothetical protein
MLTGYLLTKGDDLVAEGQRVGVNVGGVGLTVTERQGDVRAHGLRVGQGALGGGGSNSPSNLHRGIRQLSRDAGLVDDARVGFSLEVTLDHLWDARVAEDLASVTATNVLAND